MSSSNATQALTALGSFLRALELLPPHVPAAETPFAWSAASVIPYRVFALDWQTARCRFAALSASEIVLFEPDPYLFTVCLLAAWSLGKQVILPGDDLPATRQRLPQTWVNGHWRSPESAGQSENTQDNAPGKASLQTPPRLYLFTSGSRGEPERIEKRLTQLVREVRALEANFGACLTPDTRFVASVPHQHMFGLPFAILWPLTSGRPLVAEKMQYPEQLPALPPASYVLISAPTFLRHLNELVPEAAQDFRLVITAGSPLPATTCALVQKRLATTVLEIYGSTETGAVAGRMGTERFWRPLPGVRLEVEAKSRRLRIFSPLLAGKEAEDGFLTQDRARLEDGRLEILGRADRIVKIGEKRISLTQIETVLAALPEVKRAAVLLLEDTGERATLGAVLELSATGHQTLARQGKAKFDLALKTRLRDQLTPLALPRRWRYPARFPVNEIGKTSQMELAALFAPTLPQVRNAKETDGPEGARSLTLELAIPANLLWFQGHFPDLPVLPGVVQLDWVAHFSRLHFGHDLACGSPRISALKFQRLIRPGDTLELHLVLNARAGELAFTYRLAGRICARGVWRQGQAA